MTWLIAYEVIKYWLPVGSAFALLIKAYFGAKKGITDWADTLLNNHIHHLQLALEAIPPAVEKNTTVLQEELKEQRADMRSLITIVAGK